MAVTLAPWKAVLRDWQTRAVADVLAQPREDYLITWAMNFALVSRVCHM